MADLDTILNRYKKLDAIAILKTVLNKKEVQDFVIFQNTENQLRLGLDSKGELLRAYATFAYASFKDAQPGRRAPFFIADLHLSGDYYKTYIMEVLNDGSFIIDSNPLKGGENLIEKYGVDIEGLMEKNFNAFIDFILPLYNDELLKAMQA